MLLQPLDADDPETVADFEAGRDYYGPSPRPMMPAVDPPGMPGRIEEMRRRAEAGLAIFDPGADAGEHDRIGFLGSRWGYAEDEIKRERPVVETAGGLEMLPAVGPGADDRRGTEKNGGSDPELYREWDRRRKRIERAKRKAERRQEDPSAIRSAAPWSRYYKRRRKKKLA